MINSAKLIGVNNHDRTDIAFSRLNLVLGRNKSGKSTILEALMLALQDKSPRVNDRDRPDTATGQIELDWEGIGLIKRNLNPQELQVANWAGTKAVQQAELLKQLGVSKKALEAILESPKFSSMKSGEQQDLIFKLLGIKFDLETVIKIFTEWNDNDPGPVDRVRPKVEGDGPEVIGKLYKEMFSSRTAAKKELARLNGITSDETEKVDVSRKAKTETFLAGLKTERDELHESIPSETQGTLEEKVISDLEDMIEKNHLELKDLQTDGDEYSGMEVRKTEVTKEKDGLKSDIKSGEKTRDKLTGEINTLEATLKQLEKFKGKCLV
jgi:energy-coupling factor transporter ATP-binding protein EcfA2